jgi:hypothetical protein
MEMHNAARMFWLALILLMALFPSWTGRLGAPNRQRVNIGHAYVFSEPYVEGPNGITLSVDSEINFPLLFTQLVIVAALAGIHLSWLSFAPATSNEPERDGTKKQN